MISKSNVKVLKSAGINSNVKSNFRKIKFAGGSEIGHGHDTQFQNKSFESI